MKKYLCLVLVLSAAILGCSNNPVNSSKEQSVQPLASVATTCTITPTLQVWNALSQTQKNAKILTVAQTMVGNNYSSINLQCKQWVQSYVVLPASGITIGANTCSNGGNPDYHSWLSADCFNNQVVKKYSWNSGTMPYMLPGNILQIWWTNAAGVPGPHTAILVSDIMYGFGDVKDTMTWIDCNYNYDNTVRVHKITYAAFKSHATATQALPQLGFSVYQIQ